MKRTSTLTLSLLALPLVVIAVCAAFSGLLVPDATHKDILLGTTAPGTGGHLFGTDQLGRDVLQMAVAGARSAVVGPVVIALGSMAIGLLLGTIAGYSGGWLDLLLSKYADLLLALPTTLIAIVVAGLIDGGYWVTVGVLVVLFSPTDIRMVRGAVLAQRGLPYVEAAQVLGLSRWRIMFRHLVPNVLPIAFATMLINVAFALVSISALSFLGLGIGPGHADWGRQLSDGRDLLGLNWAAAVVPGLLIIITATLVNLLGDLVGERLTAAGEKR
ncbi:ABC transporter permease [Nocardioides sp.]|uniref:ABC transporter permease n=1 Tax=Nocardioides sp. TaxID=35761 RepID=UPI0026169543|nr:ABC transporter permease [Nocardioides sp.]